MDWARLILVAGSLFLIVVLIVVSALDHTTPPVVAAVMGVMFGFMIGVVLESD